MEYPITVSFDYQERLSRLTTFFRGLMVIPQWIVLWAIGIAASVIIFIAWWAILFDFVIGYVRWYTRVNGYCCLLTDKYPPFSIE